MIVVESSAWIELLRATGSPIHRQLHRLLHEQADLAVTEVVVLEILSGARSPGHRADLRDRLLAFPVLHLNGLAGYEAAAEMYARCRSAGSTIRGLMDCLIAVPVIEAGATLLHNDSDFDQIARHTTLKVLAGELA
ncbi:MAG: type II toxin-antitoxin system VapC family toxin [Actinomycetota bacterium]